MQNFFNLRPNLALILLLLLCVSGLFSLTKIEYNNSPKTFFPRDSNTMRYETKVREIFPHEELIVALFEGDNLYSRDFLDKYQDSYWVDGGGTFAEEGKSRPAFGQFQKLLSVPTMLLPSPSL